MVGVRMSSSLIAVWLLTRGTCCFFIAVIMLSDSGSRETSVAAGLMLYCLSKSRSSCLERAVSTEALAFSRITSTSGSVLRWHGITPTPPLDLEDWIPCASALGAAPSKGSSAWVAKTLEHPAGWHCHPMNLKKLGFQAPPKRQPESLSLKYVQRRYRWYPLRQIVEESWLGPPK